MSKVRRTMASNYFPGESQNGLSLIILMMVLVIGFFVAVALFRIVPVYIDNYFLNQIIDSLDDRDNRRAVENERDVRERLKKRIQMESIAGVDVADMKIEYGNELLLIDFEYEVRTPFIGNIDAVIQFEHHHEMRAP